MAQVDFEVAALVEAYRAAKRDEDEAKRRVEELKTRLHETFDTLGSDELAEGDRVLITRTLTKRQTLDAKLIEKLAPVAFEKARKISESYLLTLKK